MFDTEPGATVDTLIQGFRLGFLSVGLLSFSTCVLSWRECGKIIETSNRQEKYHSHNSVRCVSKQRLVYARAHVRPVPCQDFDLPQNESS